MYAIRSYYAVNTVASSTYPGFTLSSGSVSTRATSQSSHLKKPSLNSARHEGQYMLCFLLLWKIPGKHLFFSDGRFILVPYSPFIIIDNLFHFVFLKTGGVITSYSIHYTKLYDLKASCRRSGYSICCIFQDRESLYPFPVSEVKCRKALKTLFT